MKRSFCLVLLLLCFVSAACAQPLRVGFRAGATLTDYAVRDTKFSAATLSSGHARAGFETALVARVSIVGKMHLQGEFEYNRTGYEFSLRSQSGARQNVMIYANRIEIPVFLGFNAGPIHLLFGPAFRISHSERSTSPQLLKVGFNNSDIALTGGLGLGLHHFFLEARVTGYPRSSVHNTMTVSGERRDIAVTRQLRWSLSAGFLF